MKKQIREAQNENVPMKTKSKISAYILRGSTTAMLFSCVFVALCLATHVTEQRPKALPPQDNASFDAGRTLSFAERVAYQTAIEDVYWRHRIWPNTNPGPKPSLDKVISQADIENKVTEYLRNSQALEDHWQRPITAEQLQAELDRMAQHTRRPEVLRELFEALGNDPFVIAECLARPALAERSLTDLYAHDQRFHGDPKPPLKSWLTKTEARMPVGMTPVSTAYVLPAISSSPDVCTNDTWTATSAPTPPPIFSNHSPILTPESSNNAPTPRRYHTAVWTGSEMIVWGGYNNNINGDLNTGGRYNPATDSWSATTTNNAPLPRESHTAIWTGSEMIVWGGVDEGSFYLNTGGRYNPTTDSWQTTTTNNARDGRAQHTAVWTGSEMIVWGGWDGSTYLYTARDTIPTRIAGKPPLPTMRATDERSTPQYGPAAK
jgi:hypothetical protein